MAAVTQHNVSGRRSVWGLARREWLWLECWGRFMVGERTCLVETLIRYRRWDDLEALARELEEEEWEVTP